LKTNDKGNFFPTYSALILSLLLHASALLVFLLIELESESSFDQRFVTIDFKQTIPEEATTDPAIYETEISQEYPVVENLIEENVLLENEIISFLIDESVSIKSDTSVIKPDPSKYVAEQLKLARTLLDTFLILHPEYRKLIFAEHSKTLGEDLFPFTKPETRMNTYIRRLLNETYPEGADHAIFSKLNPGINFPIDKLIDLAKKIF
jgi:hypothetical protein